MTQKVHAGFTSELFSEIQALLGSKGYISYSIGADLRNIGEATEETIALLKEDEHKYARRAEAVYNKANRVVIKFD